LRLTDSDSNHKVVDCSQTMLVDHSYWPIVSDLINLLAHRDVALYFMADKKLLTFWANIISCFQGLFISFNHIWLTLFNRLLSYDVKR